MSDEVTSAAIETLQNSTVENQIVKLPPQQLDRAVYVEVKKRLELIGGKWKGGKVQGFVFDADPTELLQQIANGEKRNLKKEFQFFATPADLADQLVEMADINEDDRVLEPSAGQGAIIKAIKRIFPSKNVSWCELMPVNQTVLQGDNTAQSFVCENFLEYKQNNVFDRIVANPPFSKNQDIDHIRHMYSVLKPGGRLVSIASNHWKISDNKKETQFRDWLDELGASVEDIDAGAFKESGTNISACIITIDKPAA